MLLLSLKNGWQPLLFELEDSGEVWKLFCGLQNKLPKVLLFNEANHKRFELSHCTASRKKRPKLCFVMQKEELKKKKQQQQQDLTQF